MFTISFLLIACKQGGEIPFFESGSNEIQVVFQDWVPEDAIVVYDQSSIYPFAVWTEPAADLDQIVPDSFHVQVYPLSDRLDEDPYAAIGWGTDDEEAVPNENWEHGVDAPNEATIVMAYVGDRQIDGWTYDYSGPAPLVQNSVAIPPPYASSTPWVIAAAGTHQISMTNTSGSTYGVDMYHEHSAGAGYHNLSSTAALAKNACWYAYDCVNANPKMKWRVNYTGASSGNFSYYTYCKKSC